MPVRFRQVLAAAVTVAAAVAAPHTAGAQVAAQKGAPDKGTWGAETSSGAGQNATLLLFVSPRWALQGGGGINSFQNDAAPDRRYTTSNLLLGVRRYGGEGLGFRPVLGAGASIGTATGNGRQLGVFGEVGASYFFNRHLSLGANGTATYLNGDRTSSLQIGVARLTAAVFF